MSVCNRRRLELTFIRPPAPAFLHKQRLQFFFELREGLAVAERVIDALAAPLPVSSLFMLAVLPVGYLWTQMVLFKRHV